jgi:hypothetical protein
MIFCALVSLPCTITLATGDKRTSNKTTDTLAIVQKKAKCVASESQNRKKATVSANLTTRSPVSETAAEEDTSACERIVRALL